MLPTGASEARHPPASRTEVAHRAHVGHGLFLGPVSAAGALRLRHQSAPTPEVTTLLARAGRCFFLRLRDRRRRRGEWQRAGPVGAQGWKAHPGSWIRAGLGSACWGWRYSPLRSYPARSPALRRRRARTPPFPPSQPLPGRASD